MSTWQAFPGTLSLETWTDGQWTPEAHHSILGRGQVSESTADYSKKNAEVPETAQSDVKLVSHPGRVSDYLQLSLSQSLSMVTGP